MVWQDIWATLGDNHTLPRGGLLEHMAPHSIYFYHLNSQLGICIPSECSSDDIKNLANISKYFLNSNYYQRRRWEKVLHLTILALHELRKKKDEIF